MFCGGHILQQVVGVDFFTAWGCRRIVLPMALFVRRVHRTRAAGMACSVLVLCLGLLVALEGLIGRVAAARLERCIVYCTIVMYDCNVRHHARFQDFGF